MLSAKQILEQQRKAKKAKQKERQLKIMAKDDRIDPREWLLSPYRTFLLKMYDVLKSNKITHQHLVDDFPQFHRMTFWSCEYDLKPVRQIIEKTMSKYLSDYTPNNFPVDKLNDKVIVHYKHREILCEYIKMLSGLIMGYTSRYKFAIDNNEMILNHQLYTKMSQLTIDKWSDWEGVQEAYEIINNRITAHTKYGKNKNAQNNLH